MPRCAACGDEHPLETTVCPRTGETPSQGPCGTRIDRYQVERFIGGGGMGAVYVARHTMLQHPVALKLLHPAIAQRGDILERFLREARATASLGNRHIVRVHDCAVTPEGTAFIAMERLEGESVQGLLDREKRLEPGRAMEITGQILDGLAEAHAAGIVHRDMKPGNVFLTPTRNGDHVTILDFGISKIRSSEVAALTQTGSMMGTPHYMAPEQIWNAKEIDHRADLYAVGVMLYEMLTGRLPYEARNDAELLVKACTTDPIPLRELGTNLPASLVQVVDRAMLRDPGQRFQSATEFADALRAILRAASPPTMPPAPPTSMPHAPPWQALAPTALGDVSSPTARVVPRAVPPPPPRRRLRWIALGLLAVVVLVLLVCEVVLTINARASASPSATTASPPPSLAPVGGPQRGGNVVHPGPGGVIVRTLPGGGIEVSHGGDAGGLEPEEE